MFHPRPGDAPDIRTDYLFVADGWVVLFITSGLLLDRALRTKRAINIYSAVLINDLWHHTAYTETPPICKQVVLNHNHHHNKTSLPVSPSTDIDQTRASLKMGHFNHMRTERLLSIGPVLQVGATVDIYRIHPLFADTTAGRGTASRRIHHVFYLGSSL